MSARGRASIVDPAAGGRGRAVDFELCCKPGWDPVAVKAVRGRVTRLSSPGLRLQYVVEGRVDALVLAGPGPSVRQNDLWQTTCFELFLKPAGGEAYLELNFSPSGAWAAYGFAAYRAGMAQAALIAPPRIAAAYGEGRLELDVALSLDLREPRHAMGVAAVIEERGALKSYWALNHPAGEPDFHHPCCFDAELPPPAAA